MIDWKGMENWKAARHLQKREIAEGVEALVTELSDSATCVRMTMQVFAACQGNGHIISTESQRHGLSKSAKRN